MTEWDVDDRVDFQDFQDEAKAELREEARRDASVGEFNQDALHCGNCGFRWRASWLPNVASVRAKMLKNPRACPVCGSERKAER